MKLKLLSVMCCSVVMLSGCQTSGLYHWGDYETNLYEYYKAPTDSLVFSESLKEVVQEAELKNKVPPGLYAEYGNSLLQQGKLGEAISMFEKEKALWPESQFLMTSLIETLSKKNKS